MNRPQLTPNQRRFIQRVRVGWKELDGEGRQVVVLITMLPVMLLGVGALMHPVAVCILAVLIMISGPLAILYDEGRRHTQQGETDDGNRYIWYCEICTHENYPSTNFCSRCGAGRVRRIFDAE